MKKETTKTDKLIEDVKEILPKKSGEINVFKVLQCHEHEIRHSNILAWLIDPKESHGLSDIVLKQFVEKFCSKTFGDLAPENVKVFREAPARGGSNYRYDILILDKKNKKLILIENKWNCRTSYEQLSNYSKTLEIEYPKYQKQCIILEKSDSASMDVPETWRNLKYKSDVIPLISSIQTDNENLRLILNNYIEILNETENGNKALLSHLNKFEEQYSEEIDFLVNDLDETQIYLEDSEAYAFIEEHFSSQKRVNRFLRSDAFIKPFASIISKKDISNNQFLLKGQKQGLKEPYLSNISLELSADDKKVWVQIVLNVSPDEAWNESMLNSARVKLKEFKTRNKNQETINVKLNLTGINYSNKLSDGFDEVKRHIINQFKNHNVHKIEAIVEKLNMN